MRRIARIALPLVSLLMLGIAAVLIAQNVHDLPSRRAAGAPVAARQAAAAPLAAQPADASASRAEPTSAGSPGDAFPASASVDKDVVAVQNGTFDPAMLATDTVIPATGISMAAKATHPYFLQEVRASGGLAYGITRNEGIFVSTNGGATWEERSNGLPLRVIYPFTDDPIATLTSVGVDPSNPERVAVTTNSGIYLSEDAGLSWTPVPVHPPIKPSAYFTSVALSPSNTAAMAVGTSFSGIFVTDDAGKSWKGDAYDLAFLYQGAGFYEEVAGLAYSPTQTGVLYMGVGFGGGVYRSTNDGKGWTSVDFPGVKNREIIRNLSVRSDASPQGALPQGAAAQAASTQGTWSLRLETDRQNWSYSPARGTWNADGLAPLPPPPSPEKQARMAAAADHAGIYLSPRDASGETLDHWIAFLKQNGLNTIVVDVKDDFGRLTYNSRLPFAWKIGAVHPFFNIEDLIKKAHANGIYVVGRMVIFKDEELYKYDHNRYAIWDPQRNAPWGHFVKVEDSATGKTSWVQKEFWVDPFSQAVWRYNVSIAEELQSLGIDEIQFDYIRFPSAVTSTNAYYRFRLKGMNKGDALESFLVMARKALRIPISVDLFGYNSWYPIAGWVGQNIDMYSNYADVICPMFYPSLFPLDFLPQLPYLKRANYLYKFGTWRAEKIVDGRALIRPFVQSFLLLPSELAMDTPEYSEYLREQLAGAQESHASGFTLWNFGNNYYMVTFPLKAYVPVRP